MSVDARRPHRQDTFDLREQMLTDAANAHQHHPQALHLQQHGSQSHEDEEHSLIEDDSEGEQDDDQDEFMDEDDSSSLSIPNETIDFDLVYSLHTFVATVEGQANVVKGDSLFLMDDSNSYWWLVRVLKTQEVGYIPAENIETPYERLARLNKHRNVDLAAATPEERTLDPLAFRVQQQAILRQHGAPIPQDRRISFYSASVFHYPPAVWNEEEQEGWENDDYESYDTGYEHALNDEEDWDEGVEEDWDDLGISGPAAPAATTPPTFAQQQGINQVKPLTLQQQQVQQHAQQRIQQPSQYAQDPQQQRALQQQQQQASQYAGQDRIIQQQTSTQSLQQQTSNNSLRQQGSNPSLRGQGSKEGLSSTDARSLNSSGSASPAGGNSPREGAGAKVFDPEALDATETRKISVTPTVAREQQYAKDNQVSAGTAVAAGGQGPLLPSQVLAQQQESDRKRGREREDLEEEARKRRQKESGERPSSQQSNRPEGAKGKLQKNPSNKDLNSAKEKEKEDENGGKKKGLLGNLFGRKKEKGEKSATSATKVADEYYGRGSSLSASDEGVTTSVRSGYSTERTVGQSTAVAGSPEGSGQGHGARVQQIDMKQQAAYQRYLESANKETAPQPSYGFQSYSSVLPNASPNPSVKAPGGGVMKQGTTGSGNGVTQMGERTASNSGLRPGAGSIDASLSLGGPGSSSGHQRPGSLILTAAGLGYSGTSVPELSVMRVFAGSNLSTEATFKTVLLNTTTTASDLVKQAMQRFRVAAGEDSADYYLTVKTQVEGSFMMLQAHEKPLGVFEQLVEANARDEMLPTIKRSSITSISSLSSNLSMHPAIRRLQMNDFTDDSAVKFYLNRYDSDAHAHVGDRMLGLVGEEMVGPEGGKHESLMSMGSTTDEDPFEGGISAPNSTNSNLAASERLTSSSARFALQVLIYPDDLPDGMVFDPHTEAIVPKHSLKDRAPNSLTTSSGIPQSFRRKVFIFPKNTTVAEVIELGLERFGISEGVVDGGDEVEDKGSKRRSASRVRYGLNCLSGGQEKELLPSSKVLDAFPRPPSFRMIDQRRSGDGRRRSADASLLLGSPDDVHPDDPAFILRRSIAYRMNNAPRNRLSAPLDELALSHLRESLTASETSTTREDELSATPTTARSIAGSISGRPPPAQLSRQEIIAAQRKASRANQRAILSAQANLEHGVDILLPDKATIRSSRIGGTGGAADMIRYSYIEPDGETYDISEIMEEEWTPHKEKHDGEASHSSSVRSRSGVADPDGRNDLLEGALGRQGVSETGQQSLGEKIDRVLNKIKANPNVVGSSGGRRVSAIYTDKDIALPPPSRPERAPDRAPSRSTTPIGSNAIGKVPTVRGLNIGGDNHRPNQLSVQSFEGSDLSVYESTNSTPNRLDMSKSRPSADNVADSPNRSMLDEGTEEDHYLPPASTRKRPLLVLKDHDFGLKRMMAVIEMKALMSGPAPWQANSRSAGQPPEPRRIRRQQSMLTSDTIVDDLLFGPKIDVEEMHPRVREIYEPVAKRLDALDKQIDDLLFEALRLSKRG